MDHVLLLGMVAVGALLLTRMMGLPLVNASSVVVVPWMISVTVAIGFGGISDPILELTWVMLLVSTVATIAGTIVGRIWPYRIVLSDSARSRISLDTLRSRHRLLTVVLSVYVVTQFLTMWPTIAAVGGLSAVLGGGGDAYRRTIMEDALAKAQTGFGEGGVLAAVLAYVLFVVGMSSLFTGALLWVAGYRLAAATPVVLFSLISILTLQRTSIVLSVLLFTFGVLAVKWSGVKFECVDKRRRGSRISGVIAGIFAFAVAFGFILFLSESRGVRVEGRNVLLDLSEYLLGGLAGLNARNSQGVEWNALPAMSGGLDPSPGMGGYTFSGLWSVLSRFGFPVTPTRFNLDFTPVTFFGDATITNVTGAPGEYYLDFRWAGIVVISALVALVTTLLQRKILQGDGLFCMPGLAYLLTIGAWSFFGSWFSDFRLMLLAILGGFILRWATRGQGGSLEGAVPALRIAGSGTIA